MKKKSDIGSASHSNLDLKIPPISRGEMRKGTIGKYASGRGSRVVGLDPDVARVFRNSESVNMALRAIIRVIPMIERKSRKSA